MENKNENFTAETPTVHQRCVLAAADKLLARLGFVRGSKGERIEYKLKSKGISVSLMAYPKNHRWQPGAISLSVMARNEGCALGCDSFEALSRIVQRYTRVNGGAQ